MDNITLVCHESFDGIMTAVYDGWVYMNRGYNVSIHPGENYAPTFFSQFVPVETDLEKAVKVAKSIRVKISLEAYTMVFRACMHYEEDRGDAVFGFLTFKRKGKDLGRIPAQLLNQEVFAQLQGLFFSAGGGGFGIYPCFGHLHPQGKGNAQNRRTVLIFYYTIFF